MSTKIYTGFKLPMPMDEKALAFLQACRKQLLPVVMKKVQTSEVDLLLAAASRAKIEGKDFETIMSEMVPAWNPRARKAIIKEFSKSPVSWAREVARLRTQASESPVLSEPERSRIFNLKSGLHLLPYKGETYGIAWGPDDITSAFLTLPGVMDFAYWNNTDPPENISDEEWDARGRIWDIVIPGICADGLLFKLFDSDMDPCFPGISVPQVEQYLKDNHDALVTGWANCIVREELQQENIPSDSAAGESFNAWSLMCDAMDEIRKKTPRGQKALVEAKKLLPTTWDELAAMFPNPQGEKHEGK